MTRRLGIRTIDVLIVALAVIAGSSLAGILAGQGLWIAATIGALTAAVPVVVSRLGRLLTSETVAVSLVLMMLVGGFVVSNSITPDYPLFLRQLIGGWADLLTTVPPARASGPLLAQPFVLSWMAAAGGFAIDRLVRVPALSALAPLAVFGLGLLFSVELENTAKAQGAVLLALALALGWFQQRALGYETDNTIGSTTVAKRRSRHLSAAAMLLLLTMAAPLLAPRVPGLDTRPRFDLRDRLEPPWNPLEEPSPLATLKTNYDTSVANDVAFTITGSNIPRRWKLVVLPTFDGEVWGVEEPAANGRAPYVPIESILPVDGRLSDFYPQPDASPGEVFTIEPGEGLTGPWLPMPEWPYSVDADQQGIHYNPYALAAADPGQTVLSYTVTRFGQGPEFAAIADSLGAGDSSAESVVRGVNREQLATWTANAFQRPDLAEELLEPQDEIWRIGDEVTALRDRLVVEGGLDRDARPGHSWGRMRELLDADQLVGFEEQFVSLAAMALNERLPTRVVVGYVLDGEPAAGETTVEVTRGEASAWVEVFDATHGWVAIDITPDEELESIDPATSTLTRVVAAPDDRVDPAPEAGSDNNQISVNTASSCAGPSPDPNECATDEESAGGLPVRFLGAGAAAVALPAAWALGVLGLKHRRRRFRRSIVADPNRRVAGAWYEANDRLLEAGDEPRSDESPVERAERAAIDVSSQKPLITLAAMADEAAFGPAKSDDADAERAWFLYDRMHESMLIDLSTTTRVRQRMSVAPLRNKDPIR